MAVGIVGAVSNVIVGNPVTYVAAVGFVLFTAIPGAIRTYRSFWR